MALISAKQIAGLTLAVDPKKLDKPAVLSGKNFAMDVNGPKSVFGFTQFYREFTSSDFVQEVKLGTELFYFAHNIDEADCFVYRVNYTERQLEYQISIPQINASEDRKRYPWNQALVGGLHYVNHISFGIYSYDALLNVWTDVSAGIHASLGTTVVYDIAESAGRMVYLTPATAHWSAIDDATDVTLDPVTGAGFQSLALIGTPQYDHEYKGVFAVADGFLTFTQAGVMKSTIIDSINPFRHDPWSSELIPYNQRCIIRLATTELVMLTATGLYSTDGVQIKPWQPLMSEYLKTNELPALSLNELGQVQLHYDHHNEWVLLSLSKTRAVNNFSRAFVLYLPIEEWGSFDYTHRAFISVDEFGDGSNLLLAFIDANGRVNTFTDTTANLVLAPQAVSGVASVANEVFYADAIIQYETTELNNITLVNSVWKMDASNAVHDTLAAFGYEYPTSVGFYELWSLVAEYLDTEIAQYPDPDYTDEGTHVTVSVMMTNSNTGLAVFGFAKQPIQQESLDSVVEIGLFRLVDNTAPTQLTEINEVMIGMEDASGTAFGDEDYLLDYSTDIIVDWATEPDIVEDWGDSLLPASTYTQTLIGTIDGFSTFEDNEVELEEVLIHGKTKHCVGEAVGLYHKLKIESVEIGSSFHLKDLELNGFIAGRL